MIILQIFTYATIIVFVAAVIARFLRIASAPVHLRWELYPVPHEKGRAHYGGSRLEEVDWWEKKQEKDHLGELKVMIPEILLLKGVWDHNKALWIGSFPFHFGLYLLAANIPLLIIAAILGMGGTVVNAESTGLAIVIYYLILLFSFIGSIVGILGSIRLFFHRMTDDALSTFSNPSHYFNILLICAMFVSLLVGMLGQNFIGEITGYYSSVITFSALPDMSAATVWHIGITLAFIIYLPFTHMTHFFTKYFTYHKVRWEDEPNKNGSPLQSKIGESLSQPVTWAAPHIGADGKKNWIAIVSETPGGKEK